MLAHGPSAVVYAVCDQVVDGYEQVGAALVEDVDEVELSVFSEERTNDSARIYVLKRELAEVRRAVLPLRDPIGRFANGTVPWLSWADHPVYLAALVLLAPIIHEVHFFFIHRLIHVPIF